jgi:hypothetical protein
VVLVHCGGLYFAKSKSFLRHNFLPARQKQPQADTPANFQDDPIITLWAEWEADFKRVRCAEIKLASSVVGESFKEMNGQIFFPLAGGVPQDREFGCPYRIMFGTFHRKSSRERFAGQVAPIVRFESNVNVEANHDWSYTFVGVVGSGASCPGSEVALVG